MTPRDQAFEIVRREGGWVDDPDDRGGATNYGVSLKYAQGIGLDLDGDGDTDAQDIKLVTPEKAVELYLQDFFYGPKIDRLPECLHSVMFDTAVNTGAGGAIIILQTLLGILHDALPDQIFDCGRPDGALGKKSFRSAVEALDQTGEKILVNAYVDQRIQYYKDIVRRRPSQKKFIKGWTKRALEFKVGGE